MTIKYNVSDDSFFIGYFILYKRQEFFMAACFIWLYKYSKLYNT